MAAMMGGHVLYYSVLLFILLLLTISCVGTKEYAGDGDTKYVAMQDLGSFFNCISCILA